jgi:hypothetical protein
MSLDENTDGFEKSISEWVVEWIEEGNSWSWMNASWVHRNTENKLKNKLIAERELLKSLKSAGIEAEETI